MAARATRRSSRAAEGSAESRSPEALLERAAEILHRSGERMTGPRRAVLTALSELGAGGAHVSAEDVVERVRVIDAGVHRASVYRTLDALTRLEMVQHVHLGHGATAYHLVDEEHPHAQCTSCGRVFDLPEEPFAELARRLRDDAGFRVDAGHIALAGVCADCAASASGADQSRGRSAER